MISEEGIEPCSSDVENVEVTAGLSVDLTACSVESCFCIVVPVENKFSSVDAEVTDCVLRFEVDFVGTVE